MAKTVIKSKTSAASNERMLFGKQNYLWMLIGFVLVLLGLLLMVGGNIASPEAWDESVLYSTRRTVLAPIVILAGFVVEVFAIFKKNED